VYVAPALGGWKSSGFFGVAILVYFLVLGFLLLFLWTRVNLPLLYAQSDVDQTQAYDAGRKEGILVGEKRAVDALGDKISPRSSERAARDLAPREAASPKRVLWVDDQPLNNQNEIRILKDTLFVQVDTSLSAQDALEKLGGTHYDLIVSAMENSEGRQAGLEMLTKLRASEKEQNKESTPCILYSPLASAEIMNQAEMKRALATNSPLALIDQADAILRG
jgi:CheY-like chemotaxis protein